MAILKSTSRSAREYCEALLRADRNAMIERSILPSEVRVIDRLLERGLELEDAYEELHSKLSDHPRALKKVFELLQDIAAFSNGDATLKARMGKAKLIEVNREIAKTATALAVLLNVRIDLENRSGFACETLYHPVDAIHAAGQGNYQYEHHVKEELSAVRGRFNLKYWPSLVEVVQVIANDAARAEPLAQDPVIAAGTEGLRAGLADSFKAFFAALEESSTRNHGLLPDTFELTDRSVAIFMSCALGLGPDDVVNSAYVKRLRQRVRERG